MDLAAVALELTPTLSHDPGTQGGMTQSVRRCFYKRTGMGAKEVEMAIVWIDQQPYFHISPQSRWKTTGICRTIGLPVRALVLCSSETRCLLPFAFCILHFASCILHLASRRILYCD